MSTTATPIVSASTAPLSAEDLRVHALFAKATSPEEAFHKAEKDMKRVFNTLKRATLASGSNIVFLEPKLIQKINRRLDEVIDICDEVDEFCEVCDMAGYQTSCIDLDTDWLKDSAIALKKSLENSFTN